MKRICKIIFIVFIMISLYSAVYTVQAEPQIFKDAKSFLSAGDGEGIIEGWFSGLGDGLMRNKFSELLGVLWGIGLLVIFVSTVVLGIKYMMVNPNERSQIKQATSPYIIGVVIIFGAVTIWKFIIELLEG